MPLRRTYFDLHLVSTAWHLDTAHTRSPAQRRSARMQLLDLFAPATSRDHAARRRLEDAHCATATSYDGVAEASSTSANPVSSTTNPLEFANTDATGPARPLWILSSSVRHCVLLDFDVHDNGRWCCLNAAPIPARDERPAEHCSKAADSLFLTELGC